MTTVLTRTAGVAVTAGLLVAGLAGTAAAADKATTSLSIRSVASGATDTISGSLRTRNAPLANRTVALAAEPAGASSYRTIASHATGQNGGVSFAVSPAATTRYKLVFAGDAADQASHSGIVTVVRRATSLSIRSAKSSINPGGSDTISGALLTGRNPLASRTVHLLSRAPGGSWTAVQKATTGAHGNVSFRVSPNSTRQFQLAFYRTGTYAPARSGVVTVIVRRPTSLSIRAASSSVKAGASTIISGVLLSGRTAVAGRSVTLLSRPAGATSWTRGATKVTGEHGGVSYTVTPSSKTQYVLSFALHPRYLGSRSGVVTVNVV